MYSRQIRSTTDFITLALAGSISPLAFLFCLSSSFLPFVGKTRCTSGRWCAQLFIPCLFGRPPAQTLCNFFTRVVLCLRTLSILELYCGSYILEHLESIVSLHLSSTPTRAPKLAGLILFSTFYFLSQDKGCDFRFALTLTPNTVLKFGKSSPCSH